MNVIEARPGVRMSGGAQAQVIGSVTFGSPAARTYSISSGSLTLAMASGTYNVQAGQIFRIADP